MIPSLPRGRFERYTVAGYVAAFFLFLFLPLAVVALFAFNDANYPAPPWRGATLDWFVGNASRGRVGLFADRATNRAKAGAKRSRRRRMPPMGVNAGDR